MKRKLSITLAFVLISFLSIGQNNANSQLSNTISYEDLRDEDPKKATYKEKEWKKIKKQLRRTKKRFSNPRNTVHTYKKIDTVYLNAPKQIKESESRLSDW